MNIFYLIPYVPNQIRVRPFSLIKSMAQRGHQITLFTLSTSPQERDSLGAIAPYCQRLIHLELSKSLIARNVIRTIPSNQPLQAAYSWHPNLYKLLLDEVIANHPDVIHIEHLRGSRYGINLLKDLKRSGLTIPIFWDSVDCISYLFQQAIKEPQSYRQNAILRFELPRTRAYERKLVSIFNHILVTSSHDKLSLQALSLSESNNGQIKVIPNGVDLDYFKPDPSAICHDKRIIVTGKMSYHANIRMVNSLLKQIMPLIWRVLPEVELWIVGKDPPDDWQATSKHSRITITGTVPDIRPYLHSAAVAVAPIAYGAGIQNKVLEAMASETAVVATSKAVSALQAAFGEHLLVADTPETFAGEVINLLSDRSYRTQIARAGRIYVQEHHDWKKIAALLETTYIASINFPPGQEISIRGNNGESL